MFNILVVKVSHLAYGSPARVGKLAYLAGWQAHRAIFIFLAKQLRGCAGAPYYLPTLVRFKFEIVYHGSCRYTPKR
jgi:AMMECR1 domain-containing protein